MNKINITREQFDKMLDDFILWLKDYDWDWPVADIYERPGPEPWLSLDMATYDRASICTYVHDPEDGWVEDDYEDLDAARQAYINHLVEDARERWERELSEYAESDYDWWLDQRANHNPYVPW